MRKNLHISKKKCNFASDLKNNPITNIKNYTIMATETKIFFFSSLNKKEYKATKHLLKAMEVAGKIKDLKDLGYCEDEDCYFHQFETTKFCYDELRSFQVLWFD